VVSLQREYTGTTAARGRAPLELMLATQLDDAPSGVPNDRTWLAASCPTRPGGAAMESRRHEPASAQHEAPPSDSSSRADA